MENAIADVLDKALREVGRPVSRVDCNTCATFRLSQDIGALGACLHCGQMPDASPGDPCNGCGGEGVVDGLVVGDGEGQLARCWACRGFGVVPIPSEPAPPAAFSPATSRGRVPYRMGGVA